MRRGQDIGERADIGYSDKSFGEKASEEQRLAAAAKVCPSTQIYLIVYHGTLKL